jgi:hypothetical protein
MTAAAALARKRSARRRDGRPVLQPLHFSTDCCTGAWQPGFHAPAPVGDTLEAVLYALISIALLLLLIGWTWNTRPGYTGIDVFFSRYLLTIGLPFEKWLHRLTILAAGESDPEKFLPQALDGNA